MQVLERCCCQCSEALMALSSFTWGLEPHPRAQALFKLSLQPMVCLGTAVVWLCLCPALLWVIHSRTLAPGVAVLTLTGGAISWFDLGPVFQSWICLLVWAVGWACPALLLGCCLWLVSPALLTMLVCSCSLPVGNNQLLLCLGNCFGDWNGIGSVKITDFSFIYSF